MPTNNGDVAVILDPEPEQSLEEMFDDASQPAYREEELFSEARNTSLHPSQRHRMDTRLCTRMRVGGSCRYYQQFGSSTDTDEESSSIVLSSAKIETNEEPELVVPSELPAIPQADLPLSPHSIEDTLFTEL